MYIRYPLSLRQVEDLLSERGIDIGDTWRPDYLSTAAFAGQPGLL